jgi:hypothetical protein
MARRARQPEISGGLDARRMQCPECSAETPDVDRFCRSCGSPTRGTATLVAVAEPDDAAAAEAVADRDAPPPIAAARPAPPRPTAAEPAAAPSPAPTPTAPSQPSQGARLLPAFPCRLLWSPRRPWKLQTSLTAAQATEIFTRELTSPPTMLRRFNSYHRRVTWELQRNAVSGQVIATCRPSDLIPVGFGRNKVHVDVSGDTLVLDVGAGTGGRTEVTVGVGRYTRWWSFYMFPATNLTYDVVRALKKADRSAQVQHPWSVFRAVMTTLAVVFVLAASASGSGSGGTASGAAQPVPSSSSGDASAAVASAASSTTDEEDDSPVDTTTTDTMDDGAVDDGATTAATLPDEPRSQMATEITDLLRTWHQDVVDGDPRAAWDLLTARKQEQSEAKYGYATWAKNQQTLAPYLDPSGLRASIRDVDDRTGVVLVDVEGMRWSKPGARCSSWSGLTWVRYEDGQWRYDPGFSTTPARERQWKHHFDELLGGSC